MLSLACGYQSQNGKEFNFKACGLGEVFSYILWSLVPENLPVYIHVCAFRNVFLQFAMSLESHVVPPALQRLHLQQSLGQHCLDNISILSYPCVAPCLSGRETLE